jgi:hypothetical protein
MQQSTRQLHPMTAGQILKEAFELYRENFTLFLGIVLMPLVVEVVLGILLVASATSGGPTVILGLLTLIVAVALSLLAVGAQTVAVASRYLGRTISVGQAYSAIGADTLWVLFLSAIAAGIVIGIGLILLVIPGIYLAVRLAFVSQAVVLERSGVSQAFRRSWSLVEGSWWRVFGIAIVTFVIVAIVGSIIQQIIGALLGSGTSGVVLRTLISGAVQLVLRPYAFTVLILLYFDLRLRKEDFNMQSVLPPTSPY